MYLAIDGLIPELQPRSNLNWYLPITPTCDEEIEFLDGHSDEDGTVQPIVSWNLIPNYGKRQDGDYPEDPLIPRGLSQEHRNEDHLAEFFSAWAIQECDRFRRFVFVVTGGHVEPRWKDWNQVCPIATFYGDQISSCVTLDANSMLQWQVMTPKELAKDFKFNIDEQYQKALNDQKKNVRIFGKER